MAFSRPILCAALCAVVTFGCAGPRVSAPGRARVDALPAASRPEPALVSPTAAATVAAAATAPPAAAMLAPDLEGSAWLNSPPLRMDDLRGRVVVVDFWTFGCINCLNTLPALRELYERYRETDVALISVHTPEFEREKDVDAVRDAAKRLAIDYPIVIDNDMAIWRSYDNRYWPALYLVDKDGVIRDHHAGELHVGTRAWSRWIARIEALRRPVTPAARSGSPGTRSPDPSAP